MWRGRQPDKLCSKDVSRIQQNVQAHPELVARLGRRLAKVKQDARHSGALEGVRSAGEGVGSRKLATMDGQKSPSAGLKSQRAWHRRNRPGPRVLWSSWQGLRPRERQAIKDELRQRCYSIIIIIVFSHFVAWLYRHHTLAPPRWWPSASLAIPGLQRLVQLGLLHGSASENLWSSANQLNSSTDNTAMGILTVISTKSPQGMYYPIESNSCFTNDSHY